MKELGLFFIGNGTENLITEGVSFCYGNGRVRYLNSFNLIGWHVNAQSKSPSRPKFSPFDLCELVRFQMLNNPEDGIRSRGVIARVEPVTR